MGVVIWTPERAMMVRDGYAAGEVVAKLAARIGVSKNRLQRQARKMGLGHPHRNTSMPRMGGYEPMKKRKCLGPDCGAMFWSEGIHNRLCRSCRERVARMV